MAERNSVAASVSKNDLFAHHVTPLSGDDVVLNDVEQMVICLAAGGPCQPYSGGPRASAVSA
jgi:hypothetical protein